MTLNEFKEKVIADEPKNGNRSMDYCSWRLDGKHVLHERVYWNSRIPSHKATPAERFHFLTSKPRWQYWGAVTYADQALAKSDAKQYGAIIQKDFYCDDNNPTWFLIFDDLDKALSYTFDKLNSI